MNPILLRFMCSPPRGWSNTDKLPVQQHFVSYGFAYRYSVQAGAEMARLLDLRSNSLRTLSSDAFRAYLLDNANSDGFDVNGWSRTMYAALAETAWFCAADFRNPDWHLVNGANQETCL